MTKFQTAAVKLTLGVVITAITLAVASIAPANAAEPKVTYVGGGRNLCSGNSVACAQIDANNRAQAERDSRQYQQEQDRAQAYVDRERRREEERRNEQRRY